MSQRALGLSQRQFRGHFLKHAPLSEYFQDQSQRIREIERYLIDTEALEVASKVAELDFATIRFAVSHLYYAIDEAASLDGAKLIVESVFDTTEKEAIEYWESWLTDAPCWAHLARAHWPTLLSKASVVIIERLEAAGIPVKGAAAAQIEGMMSRLKIEDLVPAEVLAKAFSVAAEGGVGADEW